MSIEVIKVNRTFSKPTFPTASINAKSKRLFLSVDAYKLLKQLFGQKETDYVLLHRDTVNPNSLYLKPVNGNVPYRRKITKTKSTRFLDLRAILKILNWNLSETIRFKASVDKKNRMLRIDRKNPDPKPAKKEI